jgi:hypothetical protein
MRALVDRAQRRLVAAGAHQLQLRLGFEEVIAHEPGGDSVAPVGEAMRWSMLALIDTGAKKEAHPAFWAASFLVVGEGAVGR